MAENKDTPVKEIIEKDIIDLIGGESLDQEQKNELYKKMLETIRFRVIDRIDQALTDEEVDEWKKLIDADDDLKINQFMESKGIDVSALMMDEAVKYKVEVVAMIDMIKSSGQSMDDLLEKIGEAKKETNNE